MCNTFNSSLTYRAGTYHTFLESMTVRLTTLALPEGGDASRRPLQALTTRTPDDPTLAWLDAWAVVADVLTFYQERLINEGYLPTATERRSIMELARLVGYKPRPGVAASVFLAFEMEKGLVGELPAGTRVQSIPGPGETPQTFETSETLPARGEWNVLRPKLGQVQDLSGGTNLLYLAGTGLNLKEHAPILVIDSQDKEYLRFIYQVESQPEQNRTLVFLSGELNVAPLKELLNEQLKVTKRTELPDIVEPIDGATNVQVRPTLKWTEPVSDSDYLVRYREKNEEKAEWIEKTIYHDSYHELNFYQFDALKFNTSYEWQVIPAKVREDGSVIPNVSCADYLPIWGFTTAQKNTFSDLSVVREDDFWNFSWNWHGDSSYKFKITITTDEDEDKEEGDIYDSPYSLDSDLPDKFTWQITASSDDGQVWNSGEQNYPPDPVGDSGKKADGDEEIDADTVKKVANQIIELINSGEAIINLKRIIEYLNDRSNPTKAYPYVKIIKSPLGHLEALFRAFSKLQTEVDFGCYIYWIKRIEKQLQEIEDNLNVVRTETAPGRVFPNEFVNVTDKSEQSITNIIDEHDHDNYQRSLKDIFYKSTNDYITELFKKLDKTSIEDEKIILIKEKIYCLQVLKQMSKFWLNDEANNKLIQQLEELITDNRGTAELDNQLIDSILKAPSQPPANRLALDRSTADIFGEEKAGIIPHLLTALNPELEANLYRTWSKTTAQPAELSQSVQILQIQAAPFGAKEPEGVLKPNGTVNSGNQVYSYMPDGTPIYKFIENKTAMFQNDPKKIILDNHYKEIKPGGWAIIHWPEDINPRKSPNESQSPDNPCYRRILKVNKISKEGYGQLTQLELDENWINTSDELEVLRSATVYVQNEALPLTDEPITDDITGDVLSLDALYDGLTAGQWLIISGERTDIPGTSGVQYSELVMIKKVTQRLQELNLGDTQAPVGIGKTYTELTLATPLAYTYKRDTVEIYGNVVPATHGETRREVLGSGNGSQNRQQFTLKQPPLTYLPAPTRAGIESTLEVRVNDIRWPETENLVNLGPEERGYITQTDEEQQTTVIFGDGTYGKRLPTGVENVKAVYRQGIGKAGNVAANQISLLMTRPLGVKGVNNPLAATGGADPESRDQARCNVPLALQALDRLVSVPDYEYLARTFAGIGKAKAESLQDGRRALIHLTIAGVDDSPITPNSELYRSLSQAIKRYGTLKMPVQIDRRELMLLVIIANVRLHPDYLWEVVAPQLRKSLLATFSFERQALGQDVLLSQIITVMGQVRGVDYVDVDVLESISETEASQPETLNTKLKKFVSSNSSGTNSNHHISVSPARIDEGEIKPAQLAYLSPEVPDTLILKEIKV